MYTFAEFNNAIDRQESDERIDRTIEIGQEQGGEEMAVVEKGVWRGYLYGIYIGLCISEPMSPDDEDLQAEYDLDHKS